MSGWLSQVRSQADAVEIVDIEDAGGAEEA